MIGSSILLFPDTGPTFLRALRTTILYSEQVHVLTLLERNFTEAIASAAEECQRRFGHAGIEWPLLIRRSFDYCTFVRQHFDELQTLKNEAILVPLVCGPRFDEIWNFGASAVAMVREVAARTTAQERDEADWPDWLHQLFLMCPPSAFDIALSLAHLIPRIQAKRSGRELDGEGPDLEDVNEQHCEACMFHYLLALALMAEKLGLGISTWSPEFQDALWGARASFPPNDQAKLHRRNWVAQRLGQVVIENHVPRIDDLPIDEVLAVRMKRRAEIESFRSALAELATQIDPAQPPIDLELQIHDLVASRVNPAVHSLRAAVASSRLDILQKMGRSTTSLATATVPAVLAFAAGAPLNVSAGLAALGGVAGSLLDGLVEQRKLMHASQWSILLRLREKTG